MMSRRGLLRYGAGLVMAGGLGQSGDAAGAASEAADFLARRKVAATPFGDISYWEQGDGSEAALFLHGWPLNGFHWRGAMAGLSGIRRCIAPDFMGLGYSEVPDGADLSPASQCAMIVDLLDRLGAGRVDVVSNDSGTTIAQLLAVGHPERVSSLLITNGDVHTNSPPEGLKPAIEAARAGQLITMFERHVEDLAFAQGPEGLGGLTYTRAASLTSEAIQVYFRPLLASPRRRRQCQDYGVAFEPNPLPAIEGALRRLDIPARMVWGTGDPLFPKDWARWLDERLPMSRGTRLVEGARLFFPEEYPEVIIAEAKALWTA